MHNLCNRTFTGAHTFRLIGGVPVCPSCGHAVSEHKGDK